MAEVTRLGKKEAEEMRKFPLLDAERLALAIIHNFEKDLAVSRIQIAGSIRRRQPDVHDIDIVAIPAFQEEEDQNLFGGKVRKNLFDGKLSELCLNGYLQLESNGDKIKRFTIDEDTPQIDIYIADEDTWHTLLLIRTGSREHNIRLAIRARDLHMQLKADGSGLIAPGGELLKVRSEEEIFERLGLPYRSPEERD